MNKLQRYCIYRNIMKPTAVGVIAMARNTRTFWAEVFPAAWEPLALDQKFAWIFFVSNTIAILTLIEFFVLAS